MNEAAPSDDHSPVDYSVIPNDFPRPDVAASLAGFQNKLALVEFEGKLYLPGGTPPERFQKWSICEEQAQHFAAKSLECKGEGGKRAHMTEVEILEQYLQRILDARWHSDAETRWLIRRTAELLDWPVPASAMTGASCGQ
jgi:hypothetical protein